MNKVVCNVCGTSYPENASQCPICGFTENSGNTVQSNQDTPYTYVKGGRFSKTNVKKRNHVNTQTDVAIQMDEGSPSANKRSNATSIVIIIVLCLAILAVGSYIALRFFIPNNFIYEGTGGFTLPAVVEDETTIPTETTVTTEPLPEETEETEAPVLTCVSLVLNETEVTLTDAEETFTLIATPEPLDTTDILEFSSADSSVASVSADGVITAQLPGATVITVHCGNAVVECSVICEWEDASVATTADEKKISLNRKEITFDSEGQSWMLYDGGEVAVSDIQWSSNNTAVATVANGKVVAVGEGDATITAVYNDQTLTCKIHCNFNAEGTAGNSTITEASGDTKRSYKLYNPYGYADDVTIKVGEQFTLMLVDENKNEITDAEWKVEDDDCCSYSNKIVKGLEEGTTNVTATYEGSTYTCLVRVIVPVETEAAE